MEYFLPSEIARLIYGYLIDESCQSVADLFLETSSHLKECHFVVQKGRKFDTKKCGKNLVEILEILSDVSCLVLNFTEKPDNDLNEFMVNLSKALILPHQVCQIDSTLSQEARDKIDKIRTEQRRVDKKLIKEHIEIPNLDSEDIDSDTEQRRVDKKLIKDRKEIQPNLESEDIIDSDKKNRPVLQVLLEKKDWHERLAENINKAVSGKKTGDNDNPSFERVFEKKTVETIVNTLEADPTFEEILKELAGINESGQEQEVEDTPVDPPVVEKRPELKLDLKSVVPDPKETPDIIQQKVAVPVKQAQVLNPLVLSPSSSFVGFNNTVLTSTPKILIQSPQTVYQTASSSTQLLSVLSTSNTPVPQNLTSSVSSMPCAVISRFTTPYEIVGPKVYFKKDPSSIVSPNSRILIDIKSDKPYSKADILPKTLEPLKVQTEEQPENTILDNHDEPIVFKRSGVRTRGGKRRGGKVPNRLKAIAPKTESPNPIQLYVVTNQTLPEPKQSVPLPNIQLEVKDTSVEIVSRSTPEKENSLVINEEKHVEVTPVQSQSKTVQYRKRLSLSSPRRGRHIRTLEFKTPLKGTQQRKANTSPKNINSREPIKPLKNVKRGCLFKSPSPHKSPEAENPKKTKKSWDSDLRFFAENVDIPTSVGLQRKTPSEDKTITSNENILDTIQEESLNECKNSKQLGPVENDLVLSDSNASPVSSPVKFMSSSPVKFMSPNSFLKSPSASLESTLIKECARIESLSKEEKNETSEHIFRTPAKSAPIKPKNTVEMTPISKIRQEINELGKTKLVTPTLPQTPKINEIQNEHIEPEVISPPIPEIKLEKKKVGKSPKIVKKKCPQKKIKLIPAINPSSKKKKKDFDVQKTIAKCLEQAKNSLYGNKSSEIKTIQKNSPQKTTNDSKTKEKRDEFFDDESGESFPRLYLSEDDLQETEQSQTFDNITLDKSHLKKNSPIKYSPKKNEKGVENNYKKISHHKTSTPTDPVVKETLKKSDKNNFPKKGESFKKYLDLFQFDFSVTDDKTGEFTTKHLKTSQFINLFDLPPNNKIQKTEKPKIKEIKSEHRHKRRSYPEPVSDKKRRHSFSEDEDLRRKRPCSNRSSFKDDYSDKRHYSRDYRRYRERRHSPRRSRYSHKEDTPARRTRIEERNDYRLRKGFNTPKNREREKDRKSENYREETIQFKKNAILEILEENKKLNKMLQERKYIKVKNKSDLAKEDGELSDGSYDGNLKRNGVENIFSRKSGQRESPSVADDSRKLLKELDVDSFLSIVHGET